MLKAMIDEIITVMILTALLRLFVTIVVRTGIRMTIAMRMRPSSGTVSEGVSMLLGSAAES